MIALDPRLAHWDTAEGRPYSGKLFNRTRYEKNPNDLGCMCAQGQILTQIAGWTVDMLEVARQSEADRATAEAYNISLTHSILLRKINDSVLDAPSIVLTDPGKVLGDQWSKLLDFWWFCDNMGYAAWSGARDAAYSAAEETARNATRSAACSDARAAAWSATYSASACPDARAAAWSATYSASACPDAKDAIGNAVREIQATEIFRLRGNSFYFLPMFGFATPDDIPPRPSNYGDTSVNKGINHA